MKIIRKNYKDKVLLWVSSFSEHSGRSYTILARDLDGKGLCINIYNPDVEKFAIPGLFETKWGVKYHEIVYLFFIKVENIRPLKGVYFGKEQITSPEQLDEKMNEVSKEKSFDFYIYDKSKENIGVFDERSIDSLQEEIKRIKEVVGQEDYEGFIELLMYNDDDYSEGIMEKLAELFSWWLWGTGLGTIINTEG